MGVAQQAREAAATSAPATDGANASSSASKSNAKSPAKAADAPSPATGGTGASPEDSKKRPHADASTDAENAAKVAKTAQKSDAKPNTADADVPGPNEELAACFSELSGFEFK